jgi:outer membrane receptor protein involved in Fe transport
VNRWLPSGALFLCVLSIFVRGGAPAGAAVPQARPTPHATALPEIGRTRITVATAASRPLATLPLPADVVGRAEIAATAGRTIESALAAIPGFAQTGTDARFTHPEDGSITLGGVGGGIGAANALILLDDVPITNFEGGWVDWSRVPKLLVDRIEDVRSGSSSLYGTEAIGGVVAIETRVPAGPETDADLFGGNLGSFGGALAVAEPLGSTSAASLYFDEQRSSGYVSAAAPNPSQPTSLYLGRRAFLRAYSGAANRRWEFGTAVFLDHREGDPSGPSYFTGRSTFARYKETAAHGQVLAGSASVDQTDYAFDLVSDAGVDQGHSRTGWSTLGATVQDTFGGPDLRVTAGIDSRLANGHRDTLDPGFDPIVTYGGLQRGFGAFAQADALAGRTELLLSARDDAYLQGPATTTTYALAPLTTPYPSAADHHVSPRAALGYALSPTVHFRTSFSNSFSAPNWNSLYGGFYVGGGVFFAGNPTLKPETSDRVEAGVDLTLGRRSVLTFDEYRNALENRTVFSYVSPVLFERVNVGAATSAGYELSYQTQLSPVWSARAATSIARSAILSAPTASGVGKVLPQDPFQTAFGQLRYDDGRVAFATSVRYIGTQYEDDANTLAFGNALLVDASAAKHLNRNLEAYVEGQNLLNRRYLSEATIYGPPATIVVGVRTAGKPSP